MDLHEIDLPDKSVGTVICMDTLEHVEDPRKALQELFRILKPEGLLIISSVMNFPIHNYPHDYWRFTPEAFRSLLSPFPKSFVGFAGMESFPHTIVGVATKSEQAIPEKFLEGYRKWERAQAWNLEYLIKSWTPPVLQPFYTRIYHFLNWLHSRRDRSV